MDNSISRLAYKGSISNAIVEAKKQYKLFVVYVSGEDDNSKNLEQSTWVDPRVAETIARCCILLHLIEGSVEAAQFSAIYPQKCIPSISVIGFNGVMLWHNEGYISAENLIENFEKAWATLHLQETALTFLTAALASKQPEPLASSAPTAYVTEATSSSSSLPSASTDESTQDVTFKQITDAHQVLEDKIDGSSDQSSGKPDGETSLLRDAINDINLVKETSGLSFKTAADIVTESSDQITSKPESETTLLSDAVNNVKSTEEPSGLRDETFTKELHSALSETNHVGTCSQTISDKSQTAKSLDRIGGCDQVKKTKGLTDCSDTVKYVYLNIRMPDATSLQTRFTLADTLGSVKNFVDENQNSQGISYDLAVPYPRKLFTDQDMTRTLSELGFTGRDALIVVPRQQTSRSPWKQSTSDGSATVSRTDASAPSGGYFDYLRRALSFVNPFSYLGGNTSLSDSEARPTGGSEARPYSGSWHSGPLGTSQIPYTSNLRNTNTDNNARDTRASRPFGSNIHTLRHDDNDPSDRNVFWNGNSTQFGGDDDKK